MITETLLMTALLHGRDSALWTWQPIAVEEKSSTYEFSLSEAKLISTIHVTDQHLDSYAGGSISGLGLGGMITKVRAARLAARSGTPTVIAPGCGCNVLTRIRAGELVGTLLVPVQGAQAARKRWLAGHLQPHGRITIDAGAVIKLRESGCSLLPVGVKAVQGSFNRGEVVVCVDEQGLEIARGLINYNAQESKLIMGNPSSKIRDLLGYLDQEELIHRDNLVLV